MQRIHFSLTLALLALAAPAAWAGAAPPERFRGEVTIRALDTAIVVALDETGDGVADRLFLADLGGPVAGGLPQGRLGAGQVLAWPSHLLVVSNDTREALALDVPGEPGARQRRQGWSAIEASLAESYQVSKVEVGSGVAALRGAADRVRLDEIADSDAPALQLRLARLGLPAGAAEPVFGEPLDPGTEAFLKIIRHPDPGPGDGGGGGSPGCGTACSIQCGDGSSCSAACTQARCAVCSCPASCSCQL